MGQAYFDAGMFEPATFSLFVRNYPSDRGYLVCAGLEAVLDFLEDFRFGADAIDHLRSTGRFSREFLLHLSGMRFSGEVYAVAEGRPVFREEPLLEVTAPIIQAQLVESALINAINFPVVVATKAARCRHAAGDRGLIDFSLRRTQGPDAGLLVARSSYIAGFDGTSNVLAGQRLGIPVSGTMAHSFIMSFEDEIEAFRAFARTYGSDTVLLIDTYDTLSGADKAILVAREMADRGERLRAVRLDSGDMTALSKEVRRRLDEAGMEEVKIFASGSFDEFKIRDSLQDGACIDAFGVGTRMGVSADAPYTDMAYKLVACAARPVLKLSTGKRSLAGPKQVFRRTDGDGRLAGDTIARRDDELPGEPLLQRVMENGRRLQPAESLETIRRRFEAESEALDPAVRRIEDPARYPVAVDDALEALQERVRGQQRLRQLGTAEA